MSKKKKRRSIPGALLEGVLSLIDWLCETAAWLCVGLMKGVWQLLALLVRGAVWLLFAIWRALTAPFCWLWRRMTAKGRRASQCLRLNGPEFEAYVALILRDNGFRNVKITKGSGDQGADVLAERNGKTYAIQCKNYEGSVGNFAVQEAYAAAQYYGCDIPAVICPGAFTRGAIELAESTGVMLWDGEKLSHMMRISGRKPHRRKALNSLDKSSFV